jgi:RNA polymerase sigma factor for flagellar operon FliA
MSHAISRLPDREKLVITLKYYEKLSDEEIAEVLGVTTVRVQDLDRRALLRIRNRVGPDVPDD